MAIDLFEFITDANIPDNTMAPDVWRDSNDRKTGNQPGTPAQSALNNTALHMATAAVSALLNEICYPSENLNIRSTQQQFRDAIKRGLSKYLVADAVGHKIISGASPEIDIGGTTVARYIWDVSTVSDDLILTVKNYEAEQITGRVEIIITNTGSATGKRVRVRKKNVSGSVTNVNLIVDGASKSNAPVAMGIYALDILFTPTPKIIFEQLSTDLVSKKENTPVIISATSGATENVVSVPAYYTAENNGTINLPPNVDLRNIKQLSLRAGGKLSTTAPMPGYRLYVDGMPRASASYTCPPGKTAFMTAATNDSLVLVTVTI